MTLEATLSLPHDFAVRLWHADGVSGVEWLPRRPTGAEVPLVLPAYEQALERFWQAVYLAMKLADDPADEDGCDIHVVKH